MKKNLLAFIIVGLLFAGIGAYVASKHMEPSDAASEASAAFFSRSLMDIEGRQQPVSQWRNKKLVLNFWATWCAPCVEEMPALTALQREIAHKNIQILGIGIDSPSNIRQFAEKYKIAYPLYISGMEGTELSWQFGNRAGGLPFTVLISADGKVRKSYLGKLDMEELRRDLASL